MLSILGNSRRRTGRHRASVRTTMATADVLMPMSIPSSSPFGNSAKRKRSIFDPVIVDDKGGKSRPERVHFDAKKHLKYEAPSKIHSMKDIGLEDVGISPVAVSEPFQMFSPEAIQQMRAEIMSDDVWKHCQYSSNLSQCQLRGFAPEYVHRHPLSCGADANLTIASRLSCMIHGRTRRP